MANSTTLYIIDLLIKQLPQEDQTHYGIVDAKLKRNGIHVKQETVEKEMAYIARQNARPAAEQQL